MEDDYTPGATAASEGDMTTGERAATALVSEADQVGDVSAVVGTGSESEIRSGELLSDGFGDDDTETASVEDFQDNPSEGLEPPMLGQRINQFLGFKLGDKGDDSDSTRAGREASFSRRASAKVANLRAAFEKRENSDASGPSPTSKQSAEKAWPRVSTDNGMGELQKLQEKLQAETASRIALEEKCLKLEERLEGLRRQLEIHRHDHSKTRSVKFNTGEDGGSAPPSPAVQQEAARQLSDLKRSISVATRIGDQISDTALTQTLGTLYHELQNWIVNHFRRAKLLSMSDRTEQKSSTIQKLEDMQKHKSIDVLAIQALIMDVEPMDKLAVLHAVATMHIMDIFKDTLLYGLPKQNNKWHANLLIVLEELPTVLAPPALNKWRANTLDILRQSPEIDKYIEIALSEVAETTCAVLGALTDIGEQGADTRLSSFKAIVRRFVLFAHTIKVQRANYMFLLPPPRTRYDMSTMEDTSVDDSERGPDCEILCATFPTVIKIGDEVGDNEHFRNVIFRSKVLCKHHP